MSIHKHIPLFYIPSVHVSIDVDNNLLHGHHVKTLESDIAAYVGAKYAVSFNSASSALFLIFKYLAGKDEKTIKIPGMIPPVVVNAILNAGRIPEFTDETIWVGHWYSTMLDDKRILIDSAQHIMEDHYKMSKSGDSDIMLFSFYPTKPISGCDGGMIVSNDEEVIEYLRMLSMNGFEKSTSNESWMQTLQVPGWKMYMSTVQAMIILKNLGLYRHKVQELERVLDLYNTHRVFHMTGHKIAPRHILRTTVHNNINFLAYMESCNITCGIHYSATHRQPAYSHVPHKPLPAVEIESLRTVSLPFHQMLTEHQVERICILVERYNNTEYKKLFT